MDDSCQEGTAFCWMACRPLANNGTCGYGDMMVCWSDEKNITCGTSQGEKKNLDLLMMDELMVIRKIKDCKILKRDFARTMFFQIS